MTEEDNLCLAWSVFPKRLCWLVLLVGWGVYLALTPGRVAGQAPPGETYHVIASGENLFRISLRYGITVHALMQANAISDPTLVYIGQRLKIPPAVPAPVAPASVSPVAPAGAPVAEGEALEGARSDDAPAVHVVQAGENLYRIGLRYGLTAQTLALSNGLSSVNMVYVGQRLVIPSAGSIALPLAADAASQSPHILNIPLDAQDYMLSCEASAAGMVAAYYRTTPPPGYASWEAYFMNVIPPHSNPHTGFRGYFNGQQTVMPCSGSPCLSGYGVYAEPVAQALQAAGLGLTARVAYGVDYDAVKQALLAGQPVLVWVFHPAYYKSYNPLTMQRVELEPETGQSYTLIEGEHAFVVAGLSGNGQWFLVNDPYQGRTHWVSYFNRWELFDGMRIIVEGQTQ